ncbi:hypothetical protein, partial [Aphanothece stagnina]|uniref:hypothetical protein n=1 Tax=Aphanothece stagnina TaxID=1004305 RepID=UPI00398EB232
PTTKSQSGLLAKMTTALIGIKMVGVVSLRTAIANNRYDLSICPKTVQITPLKIVFNPHI